MMNTRSTIYPLLDLYILIIAAFNSSFSISLADLVLSKDLYLSSIEESMLLNILEERKILKGYDSEMTNEVRENRFSK